MKERSYHHGDLRRALLDTALEIVTEHGGTGGLTLRDAARRVGVSHNAPYRHFADKGAILAALAEEGFVELAERLLTARAGGKDAEERFVLTGIAYLRFARERPGHVAVMFGPEITKNRTPTLQRVANATFQIMKDLALDAGIRDVGEARRLGTVAWSFVHGLAGLTGQNQVPTSVGTSADDLAAIGLRHLFYAFRQSTKKP